jgi:hypothetical protein
VLLCEQTGWTLDYVRSLDIEEFYEVTEILKATNAARAHLRKRALSRAN